MRAILFILIWSVCFGEVIRFVSEGKGSIDGSGFSISLSSPVAFVLHSTEITPNEPLFENGIEFVQFFYRSWNHNQIQYHSHVPELQSFSQSGLHILVEYNSQFIPSQRTQAVAKPLEHLLGFPLFEYLQLNTKFENGGASIRSKNWLHGDQLEGNNTTEYYHIDLTKEQHQHFAHKLAITKNQKNKTGVITLRSIVEMEPIQSLYSYSIQWNSQILKMQENSITTFSKKDITLQPKQDLTIQLIHSCNNDKCILTEESFTNSILSPIQSYEVGLVSYPTAFTFQRTTAGEGFHRELQTKISVKLDSIDNKSVAGKECEILLVEKISEDFFVDQYQVEERFRFGGSSKVLLDHTIDLEKPSYQSSPNVVLVHQVVPCDNNGFINAEVELPFHYRYRMPSTQSYVEGVIPLPTVFVKFGDTDWLQVPIKEQLPLVIDIPTGQIEHNVLVINSTLIITTIGALVVLSTVLLQNKKSSQ